MAVSASSAGSRNGSYHVHSPLLWTRRHVQPGKRSRCTRNDKECCSEYVDAATERSGRCVKFHVLHSGSTMRSSLLRSKISHSSASCSMVYKKSRSQVRCATRGDVVRWLYETNLEVKAIPNKPSTIGRQRGMIVGRGQSMIVTNSSRTYGFSHEGALVKAC